MVSDGTHIGHRILLATGGTSSRLGAVLGAGSITIAGVSAVLMADSRMVLFYCTNELLSRVSPELSKASQDKMFIDHTHV